MHVWQRHTYKKTNQKKIAQSVLFNKNRSKTHSRQTITLTLKYSFKKMAEKRVFKFFVEMK